MKPIILDYALKRTGETKIFYEYDFLKSMSVLSSNKKKLFIDSSVKNDGHISSRDANKYSCINEPDLLELQTKTEVARERDDHHSLLLELESKTFTKRERDD